MLLAEVLALIAVEPANGETRPKLAMLHRQDVLTSALLMELAAQSRVGLKDRLVVVLDTLPSRHPLLTASLRLVAKHSGQLTADQMIARLASDLPALREDLLDGLVRRDILHPPNRKYRLFGTKFYPLRSTQAQNECLKRFSDAAVGVDASMSGLALLALACSTRAADHLLTFENSESAKARLRELREEISAALSADSTPGDEVFANALLEAVDLALQQRLQR
jgi:Golgi phosphoprotein 3 (GPP34)